MWVCQNCKRQFKHNHQQHSCLVVPLENHFSGRPLILEEIVRMILENVKSFSDVQVSSVKNAILVSSVSTFLALKVKKDRVEIEFVLTEVREGFPVNKVVRVSKNRVAHFVAVGSPEEVDDHLLGLITQAYQVVRL